MKWQITDSISENSTDSDLESKFGHTYDRQTLSYKPFFLIHTQKTDLIESKKIICLKGFLLVFKEIIDVH